MDWMFLFFLSFLLKLLLRAVLGLLDVKGSFFEVPEAIACRDSVLVVAQWWSGRKLTD